MPATVWVQPGGKDPGTLLGRKNSGKTKRELHQFILKQDTEGKLRMDPNKKASEK